MALPPIDWSQPWFAPFAPIGQSLVAASDWLAAANQWAEQAGLSNQSGQAIRFVTQDQLPLGVAYEAHIARTGQVPTRANLHDFFNALVWLHFPRTKRVLNSLHQTELSEAAGSGTRGRQRDAATLFDENAAIFVSDHAETLIALREHDWSAALLDSAPHFHQQCSVVLFGHALLEKLVSPYKSITAHVWTVQLPAVIDRPLAPELQTAQIDECVAQQIAAGFSSRDFCHLPVLGVPGWWSQQDKAFYADTEVFRPRRLPRPISETSG
jgi:hypothetical protein